MRKEIAQAVREIYTAVDRGEAEMRLRKSLEEFHERAPELCEWLEEHFIEGLTFFQFPKDHR